MKEAIPILSLVIAALAVIFGPLLAFYTARRHMTISVGVANKQITGPMRQAWINNLRDSTAELCSRALHYYVAGYEERSDTDYQQLTLLENKIALMLNPIELDHQRFEKSIRAMIDLLERGKEGAASFPEAYDRTRTLARTIFKREWNRIKEPINPA